MPRGGMRNNSGRPAKVVRKYNYGAPQDVVEFLEEHKDKMAPTTMITHAIRNLMEQWGAAS